MTTLARATRSATAALLQQAVHRNRLFSAAGLRERAFTRAFQDLVYPRIWEDPAVDPEAISRRRWAASPAPAVSPWASRAPIAAMRCGRCSGLR